MSQGNLRWNDIEVTWEDRDVDFYVIINAPWPGEHYVPARTLVFQMEPWCAEPWQTWGVKTWGDWAIPDPSRFLQVRAHRTHLNNAFWQLDATYQELRAQPVVKTGLLSSICSGKYFDPGHIKRVDFLKFLERKDDDVVRVDLYARDNPLGFTSWKGPVPGDVKDAAIAPYRYFFAAENNSERNFITEKLWEPLVTETLCFYWGCPNASEWIDPRAFIALDLDNFEHAFHMMKDAILANEWDKRVDVIRGEKAKVLDRYQFFPTLARVLHDELRLPPHPDDATVRYHKYFADALGATMGAVCFIHSYTRNGDTAILTEILANVEASGLLAGLSRLYVVNCGDPLTLPSALSAHAQGLRVIEFSPDASRGEGPHPRPGADVRYVSPRRAHPLPAHQGRFARAARRQRGRLAAPDAALPGGRPHRRAGCARGQRCGWVQPDGASASAFQRQLLVGKRRVPAEAATRSGRRAP